MSFLDPNSLCSYSEFQKYENSRIYPKALLVDELYMLMLSAKAQVGAERRAGKAPVKVEDVERNEGRIYTVQFRILDADMKPQNLVDGKFVDDGYLRGSKPGILIDEDPAQAGYIKGYSDPVDIELHEIMDSLTLKLR